MSANNYKFDERTKDEFISDMRKGLKAEVNTISTFREILGNSEVESPEVVYVGSDEEGKISYDDNNEVSNVDLFPDYLLKYKENRRIRANFIEVKVCNPHSRECYFKVKQLEQYKELDKVLILFVMGYDTSTPQFILVTPKQILNMGIKPTKVYGKATIKAPVSRFHWESFTADVEGRGDILSKRYIKKPRRKAKSEGGSNYAVKLRNI